MSLAPSTMDSELGDPKHESKSPKLPHKEYQENSAVPHQIPGNQRRCSAAPRHQQKDGTHLTFLRSWE
ncbi:hypothetical protein NDU88_007356 [Pleurodeles waltl]|uniref:Uncharacterized protein n=1 Tax=Pleurodeles waltl TaxID=8319 RepID=A0AAV7QPL3_PLEWA|nr:hypothetical protein NDU88_007356 [Pleurodeles waltl]